MAIQNTSGGLSRDGSFWNVTSDWTRHTYVRWPSESVDPDYYTVWVDRNPNNGVSYVGLFAYQQAGHFSLALELFQTGSLVGFLFHTISASTWYKAGVRYTSSTHLVELLINDVVVESATVDLSGFPAMVTDYALSDPGGPIGGTASAQDRIWQATRTNAELASESASPVAVLRTNLLSDVPFPAVGYYADQSGNGRDFTNSGTLTSLDDPYTPPNTSAVSALALPTLPSTIYQRVDFSGSTKTIWASLVAPRSGKISVFSHGALSGYTATTRPFESDGSTQVSSGSVADPTDVPVQFYATAGLTYLLRVTPNAGNPSPAVLTIAAEQLANSTAPALSIVVPDDADPLPAAILDAATGELLRFERFPAGEQADTFDDGTILTENLAEPDSTVDVYQIANGTLRFVRHVTVYSGLSGERPIIAALPTRQDAFYVGMAGLGLTHARLSKVLVDGTITQTWTLTNAGMIGMTPSSDGSIVYVVGQTTATANIKRWDTVGSAFLSDLVSAPSSSGATKALISFPDGTVVQGYTHSGHTFVRAVSAAGAALWTTDLVAEADIDFRLFRVPHDITECVGWIHLAAGTSRFVHMRKSDGVVLQTLPDVYQFESGVATFSPTLTPPARFGHSFSCPAFLLASALTVPTTSGRRGIYVPTRGVGGSEGGGQARFRDLGGSVMPASDDGGGTAVGILAGRIISVRPDGGMSPRRAIYVPPNAEGNTPDGRQRIIVVPIGTEGYSHR